MNTKELLDKYSDNLAGIELINAEKQALIDKILTPEIKEKLKEIDAEFSQKTDALLHENEFLAAQIIQRNIRNKLFLAAIRNEGCLPTNFLCDVSPRSLKLIFRRFNKLCKLNGIDPNKEGG